MLHKAVTWNPSDINSKPHCNHISSSCSSVTGDRKIKPTTDDLQTMREKNHQLSRDNNRLQRRISDLEKLCEDHMLLKSTLAQVEVECQSAKAQVNALQRKLQSLESELETVKKRTAAEQKNEEHNEKLRISREMLSRGNVDTDLGAAAELQEKLSDLERKYDMQVARHEQLSREMNQLRQLAPGAVGDVRGVGGAGATSSVRCGLTIDTTSGGQLLTTVAAGNSLSVTDGCRGCCGGNVDGRTGARSPFQVFVARYSYDPVQFSPNDNPEAELKLNAGDYLFIYGDVDEDGFYDGELMDGRRGLVPSNFIRKVLDEELADFHNQCHASESKMAGATSDCAMTSLPLTAASAGSLQQHQHQQPQQQQTCLMKPLPAAAAAAVSANRCSSVAAGAASSTAASGSRSIQFERRIGSDSSSHCVRSTPLVDSNTPSVISVSELVPEASAALCEIGFPRDLRLERQLVSSVLMSWSPPDQVPQVQIQSYQIYVNGQQRATIRGNDRTKALLERIDLAQIHRVSVRTVTARGQSKDQQCTLLIGNDAPMSPSEVTVLSVSSTTAVVGWLPSNSALEHNIFVNDVLRTAMRPGGFRCTISGLIPVTHYSVSVQPVLGSVQQRADNTVTVNFQTLPPELPDAPAEVQVEPGPQHGTLLVMWLPVKLTDRSCTAVITGYSVYVDGRRVKELPSPTGDHILLESQDFAAIYNPKQITIRTRASEKESYDSAPVILTAELLAEIRYRNSVFGMQNISCPPDTVDSAGRAYPSDNRVPSASPVHNTLQSNKSSSLPGGGTQSRSNPNAVSAAATYDTSVSAQSHHRSLPQFNHNHKPQQRGPSTSSDSRLVPGPTNPESGFSASQLSPLELNFRPMEGPDSLANGYVGGAQVQDVRVADDPRNPRQSAAAGRIIQQASGTASKAPMYSQSSLPHIEITRDNNGSLSDSSFDVDSEENYERRRSATTSGAVASGGMRSSGVRTLHGGTGRPSPGHHSKQSSSRQQPDPYGGHQGPTAGNTTTLSRKTATGEHRSSRGAAEVGGGSPRAVDGHGSSRLYVGLFDYDPSTMSPNPNAMNDELPFREGQIIKIVRDKDPDGFYLGEVGGRRGLVPSNMVSQVEEGSKDGVRPTANHISGTGSRLTEGGGDPVAARVGKSAVTPPSPRRHHTSRSRHDEPTEADTSCRSSRRHMVAVYSYDARSHSANPSTEPELSFKPGDHVIVYGDPDEDGFFYGEIDGRRGLVPADCLQVATSASAAQPSRSSSTDRRQSRHPSGGGSGSTAAASSGQQQQQQLQQQQPGDGVDRSRSSTQPSSSSSSRRHDPQRRSSREEEAATGRGLSTPGTRSSSVGERASKSVSVGGQEIIGGDNRSYSGSADSARQRRQ